MYWQIPGLTAICGPMYCKLKELSRCHSRGICCRRRLASGSFPSTPRAKNVFSTSKGTLCRCSYSEKSVEELRRPLGRIMGRACLSRRSGFITPLYNQRIFDFRARWTTPVRENCGDRLAGECENPFCLESQKRYPLERLVRVRYFIGARWRRHEDCFVVRIERSSGSRSKPFFMPDAKDDARAPAKQFAFPRKPAAPGGLQIFV